MDRTLCVTSQGNAFSRPDEIRLYWTLRADSEDYAAATALAADQQEALCRAVMCCGFSRDRIKTTSFSVDTVYENQRDENGQYHSVFKGYSCRHQLSLKFSLDMQKLAQIIDEVAESGQSPEIRIEFGLQDEQALCDAALQDAVRQAQHRAALLAEASGVHLGQLQRIDHGVSSQHMISKTDYANPVMLKAARAMEIEPEDVSVSQTVVFTWEVL